MGPHFYDVEDSFIVGTKLDPTQVGVKKHVKPWTLKSGGSSLGALQKFPPMLKNFK